METEWAIVGNIFLKGPINQELEVICIQESATA